MKQFICATFYDFTIGGVPTYFIRMFEWAAAREYKNILYIKQGRVLDGDLHRELENALVEVRRFSFSYKGITNERQEKIEEQFSEEDILVTADIHCFMHFMNDRNIGRCKGFFYVLHPRATQITKFKFVNLFYKTFLKKNICRSIFFMDKETEEGYCNYFGEEEKGEYFRVGDFIPEFCREMVKKKADERKKKFTILTVARMDFPFKGYVYGLVNNIDRLEVKDAEIILNVIGDGPDFKLVKELVANKELKQNLNINLLGSIPYEKLNQFYKQATIFAGGGTTLIEACKYGTPSIVTTDNQMGTCCAGYMNEEYDNVGGIIENEEKEIIQLLENIYNMSNEEYIRISEKCYEIVKKEYDINNILSNLISQYSGYSKACRMVESLDLLLIKLKEKIKKKSDK